MPWVGFELTIQALERAKAVHAIDRAATVIGIYYICGSYLQNTLQPQTPCDIEKPEDPRRAEWLFR
jgi:hypothetical protein